MTLISIYCRVLKHSINSNVVELAVSSLFVTVVLTISSGIHYLDNENKIPELHENELLNSPYLS